MTASAHLAAQYIRMSTDKQDLSPLVQREAIAAYAAAKGMEIVVSYEDEGRSGVHLTNRPALLKLLHDVTQPKQFSTVLVYDVSRWGRFQDTDAAAYYEYHCRLHDAQVIYVAEMFGAEINPITAMLKSMKRAMAAEYSRELANKSRAGQHLVIARGYQIGQLPPLGYRRCSVSVDGQRRVVLEGKQRKIEFTDRIEWVLGPEPEVNLVQRICEMYGRTGLSYTDIARVVDAEGWRNHKGERLRNRSIATLVRNEALIGNFVWGRKKRAKSMATCGPSRHDGCIPQVIDDATWDLMQRRVALEARKRRPGESLVEKLAQALERSPLLTTRDLRAQGLPNRNTICDRLGPWSECLKQAGRDPADAKAALVARAYQRRQHGLAFGHAIEHRLRESGYEVMFDGHRHVLAFPNLALRLRLLWPTSAEVGLVWFLRIDRASRNADFDILVRMEDWYRAKDFFLATPADVVARFPQWMTETVQAGLESFWCRTPREFLDRLRAIDAPVDA